jgi:hypothetical protein
MRLPNVTLIAVATKEPHKALEALKYSSKEIEFGAVKLLSQLVRKHNTDHVQFEFIKPFISIDDWNKYIVFNLHEHIKTDYCLLIHEDGFVVNPQSWRDGFLHYDYIGSPWSMEVAKAIQGGRDQELVRVGNSVSIRSKKLLELPSKINMPWLRYNGDFNEDTQLTAHNRKLLQSHGITYAPLELAIHFGREAVMPENEHITEPFVFHKHHNPTHPNWNYPKF